MSYRYWTGELIRLRSIDQKDIDARAAADPASGEFDSDLDRLEDVIHFPRSPAQAAASWQHMAQQDGQNDAFFWVIETTAGETVGHINTFACAPRHGAFQYALGIVRPYWGRGYGQEAVRLVLRYYFHELRYQKANVHVYAFNERSLRFHERLGFTVEGRLRRMIFTGGRHYDEIWLGMTREEFDGKYGAAEELGQFSPA